MTDNTWDEYHEQRLAELEAENAVLRKTLDAFRAELAEATLAMDAARAELARREAVHNAVRRGDLLPPHDLPCSVCGEPAQNWHHPDYSRPLDVVPVCVTCHVELHKLERLGADNE